MREQKSRFSSFLTYKIYFENFIKCIFGHIYSVSLLSPRLSSPPIHGCCFLFNSLLFHFTNKDSGAKYWGENLLTQKGRESNWLLLHRHPRKTTQTEIPPSGCPFLLLPVLLSLSLSLPDFFQFSMALSCQLVACSTSQPMVPMIEFIYYCLQYSIRKILD